MAKEQKTALKRKIRKLLKLSHKLDDEGVHVTNLDKDVKRMLKAVKKG